MRSAVFHGTLAALAAFDEPLVAILGWYDKGLPLHDPARAAPPHRADALPIGHTAPRLGVLIEDAGPKGAVVEAGDTILPGDGNGHAIESIGDEPLELVALIVQY